MHKTLKKEPKRSQSKNRDVMIVDDEVMLRNTIAEFLRTEGFNVTEASDGREALDILQKNDRQPCLIIFDLMMARMSGQAFRKEQLKNSKFSNIPIALMSASGTLPLALLQEMSPQTVIQKPFDLEQFLTAVNDHCN